MAFNSINKRWITVNKINIITFISFCWHIIFYVISVVKYFDTVLYCDNTMIREHHTLFKNIMMILDLCIVFVTFIIGFLMTDSYSDIYVSDTYLVLLPVLLVIWGILLRCFGMYESFRTKKICDVLFVVIEASLIGSSLFGSFVFVMKMDQIGRLHIVYSFLFATLCICIEKMVFMLFIRYQRKKGFNTKNILIVGTGGRAQHFLNLINKHTEWGIRVIGLIDEDTTRMNSIISGHKVIGSFKDVPEIIHNSVVDEVVFIVPRSWLSKIEELMSVCEIEGLKVSVAIDLFELKLSRVKYSSLEEFPLLAYESTPDKFIHLLIKRLFDIVFSVIALALSSPILLVTAVLIKVTSKGHVFFKQQRCNLNGRMFTMYKFRTMVEDAEAKLKDLVKYNEMSGPVFKMDNDPRLTKVGKFLRKFSIDELPQLWSVLKGDMSLVGPRPPIPKEVSKYEPWHRRRLSIKPGITCLWQAYGRNKITDFNEWMRLDLEYIDNWSLWLDCKILLKTVPVVLFGIGAK